MTTIPPTQNATTPKARFGVQGIMLYTMVCCVCFGLFSHSKHLQAESTTQLGPLISDLGMLLMCLIAIGVAGLGEDIFRIAFEWLGKICMSLVMGLIVTIPVIAFCIGQNMSSTATMLCAATGMVAGLLLGLLLGFRQS